MRLRPATIDDAERLFAWRNDPETRAASHQTGELRFHEHIAWLTRTLASQRRIYIAEIEGQAVGTVRADPGEVTELSWTVAPEHRGRGVGTQMVRLAVAMTEGPVRAEIKRDNVASQRIAVAAGLAFDREADGVMHFHR
jgi:RimJ/RimL family protein N-acetyltransferase